MDSLRALAAEAWAARERHFPPELAAVHPSRTQAISLTGPDCALGCAHCGGHYLKAMKPLATLADGDDLGPSCLISGGCDHGGRVPISEHAGRLADLKGGRRFNLHTGLVDDADLPAIARLADTVSFDLVGDDATIGEVLGLDRTVADYAACYARLREHCRVVPHICVGLHGGAIRGEYRALDLLKELGADSLTFIIFTPTRGTRFADRQPPAVADTAKLLAAARTMFPAVPIQLGCMRPGGRYREDIDGWAVRLGVNAIVNPAPAALREAEKLGLAVVRRWECCVL